MNSAIGWLSETTRKSNLLCLLQMYFMNRFVSNPEIKTWRFRITVFYAMYGHVFDRFPSLTKPYTCPLNLLMFIQIADLSHGYICS